MVFGSVFVYTAISEISKLLCLQISPKHSPRSCRGGVHLQLYSFFNLDARCVCVCGLCHAVLFALGNDPERTVYNTGYVPRAEKISNFAPASILHTDRVAKIPHKKPHMTQYTATGQVCCVNVEGISDDTIVQGYYYYYYYYC